MEGEGKVVPQLYILVAELRRGGIFRGKEPELVGADVKTQEAEGIMQSKGRG